jgi:hypothetical protein
MVEDCALKFEALPLKQIQHDNLCAKVKQLKALYTDWKELYNKQKKGNPEKAKDKLRQIPEVILKDLYDLKGIYEDLLTSAGFESIRVEVNKIPERNLGAEFERIHAELVDKLKMGKGINSQGRDTIPNRKLASMFLLIGIKMETLIANGDVWGKLQWAFRQFAAHLTVVHTMRLDKTYQLDIQSIGAKWPFPMGKKAAKSNSMW